MSDLNCLSRDSDEFDAQCHRANVERDAERERDIQASPMVAQVEAARGAVAEAKRRLHEACADLARVEESAFRKTKEERTRATTESERRRLIEHYRRELQRLEEK